MSKTMLSSKVPTTGSPESSHLEYMGVDAVWHLNVLLRLDKVSQCQIHWSSYRLSPTACMNAQHLLLNWWGEDAVLSLRALKENDYRKADTLLRLIALCQKLHPSQKLRELTKAEWVNIAVMMLFHAWEYPDSASKQLVMVQKPLSKQLLERSISVLKAWHKNYQLGFVNDGPEYILSTPIIEKQIKQEFKQLDVCFDSWKKGGTYGSIPFVIAHLLLADAIQILESESTKQLLIFLKL